MKKLKIILMDLSSALEQSTILDGEPMQQFLDGETGEIVDLHPSFEDYDTLCDQIESSRYHHIQPLVSSESFRIMEAFVESLPKSCFATRLEDALRGRKPFRQFKDALHQDMAVRDQWFAFRDAVLEQHARRWLAALDIEPEWASYQPE